MYRDYPHTAGGLNLFVVFIVYVRAKQTERHALVSAPYAPTAKHSLPDMVRG